MCLIMKHIRMGRPAICPYSATMVSNLLQGYVLLYASSDSAGTWSVTEEMGDWSNDHSAEGGFTAWQ